MKSDLTDFTLDGVAEDAQSTRHAATRTPNYANRPRVEKERPNNFDRFVMQVAATCAVGAATVASGDVHAAIAQPQRTSARTDTPAPDARSRSATFSTTASSAVALDSEDDLPAPSVGDLEALALANPQALLRLLHDHRLRPTLLSYAAEFAGRIEDKTAAADALLPLLQHAKSYVREGALYGLAQCNSATVHAQMQQVAEHDRDPDVRAVAADLLGAAR